MAFSAGDRLGPYEILTPIGAGGMGAVYKARDTRLNRTVAIKLGHEQFSERFEREARAVAALNHPNICQLYDVGALPTGESYLVMEHVEGSLRWVIERCLAKDPAERYDSTRDLYRELRHARDRLSDITLIPAERDAAPAKPRSRF